MQEGVLAITLAEEGGKHTVQCGGMNYIATQCLCATVGWISLLQVPTGWELPFPANLFTGASTASVRGAAGRAAGGNRAGRGREGAGVLEPLIANAATLPQVGLWGNSKCPV